MTNQYGPKTKAADALHATKYREPGEDYREAMNRVAFALKDDDAHYHEFRSIILAMRFLPAGRVQRAMGSTTATTPYNCYVAGKIEDSFVDGAGSIMDRAKEAAATMRMGGGIGYDFSTLRPEGALIKKLRSRSSGPRAFMDIFDAVCRATASSGHRRGAQMGVLRVDHPDIETFIRAKQNDSALLGFNVSVAVTDAFMRAVAAGTGFDLTWGGEVHRTVDAAALWETLMRSTYDWAEPGVLFIDRINEQNNLRYCETIAATNPCGEQPLPPFGACLLGSFNLTQYLKARIGLDAIGLRGPHSWDFDYDQFVADVPTVVRAMDNVVDRARYPLAEQRAEAITKRRMGLGVTGLANAGEAVAGPYGSPKFLAFERRVLTLLRDEAYRASANLAREKGAFPLYDEVRYNDSPFVKNLPEDVRALILKNGIRNSHLTSIAPTGTISMTADNVSSSIEPVYEYVTSRPVNTPDGVAIMTVEDYGAGVLGIAGKRTAEVTAREHVDVLVAAQEFVDSAVSKTCNVTGEMPWDDFKRIYVDAWERGAKGCTTFNKDGKRAGLLSSGEESAVCEIDPSTGRRECA